MQKLSFTATGMPSNGPNDLPFLYRVHDISASFAALRSVNVTKALVMSLVARILPKHISHSSTGDSFPFFNKR